MLQTRLKPADAKYLLINIYRGLETLTEYDFERLYFSLEKLQYKDEQPIEIIAVGDYYKTYTKMDIYSRPLEFKKYPNVKNIIRSLQKGDLADIVMNSIVIKIHENIQALDILPVLTKELIKMKFVSGLSPNGFALSLYEVMIDGEEKQVLVSEQDTYY